MKSDECLRERRFGALTAGPAPVGVFYLLQHRRFLGGSDRRRRGKTLVFFTGFDHCRPQGRAAKRIRPVRGRRKSFGGGPVHIIRQNLSERGRYLGLARRIGDLERIENLVAQIG